MRGHHLRTLLIIISTFGVTTYLLRTGHPDLVKNLSMMTVLVGFGLSAWAAILTRRAARMSFELADRNAAYQATLAAPVSPNNEAQVRIEKPDSVEPG